MPSLTDMSRQSTQHQSIQRQSTQHQSTQRRNAKQQNKKWRNTNSWRACFVAIVISCATATSWAAPQFPILDGRVVDRANLLSKAVEQSLIQRLREHEVQTSNQIVVVTLTELNGYAIDDYGYQLGRHWAIGQKDKNNGVLLIIAQNERKVRIEVGYGLEGALPDGLAHRIIQDDILPHFRQGNFEQGIDTGATRILQAIAGEYVAKPQKAKQNTVDQVVPIVFLSVFFSQMFSRTFRKSPKKRGAAALGLGTGTGIIAGMITQSLWIALGAGIASAALIMLFLTPGGRGGGGPYVGGGRHRGGGGFSGGGGSFGGGGASGGW